MADTDPRLDDYSPLLTNEGFDNVVVPRTGEQPADTLLVTLTGDDGEPEWQLELSFIPGMEAQLDGQGLLQCFVAVAAVEESALPGVLEATASINAQLLIGGFGIVADRTVAMFREVLMVPPDAATAGTLVVQTTWLTSYLMSLFADVISRTADGSTFADAIAGHPQAHLFF